MFQDFDVHQFDAFCICLCCSTSVKEIEKGTSVPPAYSILCDWLLDICKALIKPAVPSSEESKCSISEGDRKRSGISVGDRQCTLGNKERFIYFQRVCKARVWSDMGGTLFQRLKMIAQARVSASVKLHGQQHNSMHNSLVEHISLNSYQLVICIHGH
jgi:hypothetical protein